MMKPDHTLLLSSQVYSLESVLAASQAYDQLASIRIDQKSDPDFFLVSFSECMYGPKTTMKEFENYVIGLENQKC